MQMGLESSCLACSAHTALRVCTEQSARLQADKARPAKRVKEGERRVGSPPNERRPQKRRLHGLQCAPLRFYASGTFRIISFKNV